MHEVLGIIKVKISVPKVNEIPSLPVKAKPSRNLPEVKKSNGHMQAAKYNVKRQSEMFMK